MDAGGFFEFADLGAVFHADGRRHAVGEHDAFEMVVLVLSYAGGPLFEVEFDGLARGRNGAEVDAVETVDLDANIGEGKAAFLADVFALLLAEDGIHDGDGVLDLAGGRHDEHANAQADLRRGEADALVFHHHLLHALGDFAEPWGKFGDFLGAFFQDRRGVERQLEVRGIG